MEWKGGETKNMRWWAGRCAAADPGLVLTPPPVVFFSQAHLPASLEQRLSERQKCGLLGNKAVLLLLADRAEEAKSLMSALHDRFPQSDFPVLIRAALLSREGKTSKAVEALDEFCRKAEAAAQQGGSVVDTSDCRLAQAQMLLLSGRGDDRRRALAVLRALPAELATAPAMISTVLSICESLGDRCGGGGVGLDSLACLGAPLHRPVGDRRGLKPRHWLFCRLRESAEAQLRAVLESGHLDGSGRGRVLLELASLRLGAGDAAGAMGCYAQVVEDGEAEVGAHQGPWVEGREVRGLLQGRTRRPSDPLLALSSQGSARALALSLALRLAATAGADGGAGPALPASLRAHVAELPAGQCTADVDQLEAMPDVSAMRYVLGRVRSARAIWDAPASGVLRLDTARRIPVTAAALAGAGPTAVAGAASAPMDVDDQALAARAQKQREAKQRKRERERVKYLAAKVGREQGAHPNRGGAAARQQPSTPKLAGCLSLSTPQGYKDPASAPPANPERWLPKYERADYKKMMKKRKDATAKGAQGEHRVRLLTCCRLLWPASLKLLRFLAGSGKVDEALDASKRPAGPATATATGPAGKGKSSMPVLPPKSKKKGKK